jgi:hypothetical protein
MLVLLKRITHFTWLITCISLVCLITCISCDLSLKHYYLFYMTSLSALFIWPHCQHSLSGDIVSILYMTSLSSLFIWRHCQHSLYDLIVIIVYLATLSALSKIIYIAILLHLSLNLDTSITFVHVNILHLAVGCKHTGYKSLMAGLGTEWIYDAFAGKSSFICITFFFTNSMNSPTSC